MEYMEIANSPILYAIIAVPILLLLGQAVGFLRLASRQAKDLDMPTGTVKKVIVNSALFSVVPTLPLLIPMAVLMVILGKPLPLLRETVMGSVAFESFASDLTLKAFGVEGGLGGGVQMSHSIFISVVWVMTTSCMCAAVLNILFLKTYDQKLKIYKEKGGFMAVASGAMMIGMLCTLFVPELMNFEHPVGIAAGLVSGGFALLFDYIAKKYKANVLAQFSFPLSMVLGMAAAVVTSSL